MDTFISQLCNIYVAYCNGMINTKWDAVCKLNRLKIPCYAIDTYIILGINRDVRQKILKVQECDVEHLMCDLPSVSQHS